MNKREKEKKDLEEKENSIVKEILKDKDKIIEIVQGALDIIKSGLNFSNDMPFGICDSLLKSSRRAVPLVNENKNVLFGELFKIFKTRYKHIFPFEDTSKEVYYLFGKEKFYFESSRIKKEKWYTPRIKFLEDWIEDLKKENVVRDKKLEAKMEGKKNNEKIEPNAHDYPMKPIMNQIIKND
jgi:hypothetical protein